MGVAKAGARAGAPAGQQGRVKPGYWERATRELAASDPVMDGLVARFPGIALRGRGDAFATLARSIVGQQISVKAAESVWQRVATTVGEVTPERVSLTPAEQLREAGLSRQKITYLHDLSQRWVDGRMRVSNWLTLDDEALINDLTQVKGIGRWTAEMFLIFHLLRPDVLPVADLGLQKAVSLHYNQGQQVSLQGLRTLARVWIPWRSVATWYLWRSLDPLPVEY
jgi:DNA-3-methyladenine glycosylase II